MLSFPTLRPAVRSLLRRPGLAVAAIVILALGLGAAVALSGLARAVLLAPLPYAEPDRLVVVYQDLSAQGGNPRDIFSYPNFLDYRLRARSLEDLGVGMLWLPTLIGPEGGEQLTGARLSYNYLDMLGVEPVLGRDFQPAEDTPGGDRVVILGHGFWQRHFAGEREALGRTLELDGELWTVVGVLGADFQPPFGPEPEVIRPMNLDPTTGRASIFLRAVGRLAPGWDLERAHGDLNRVARELAREYPESNEGITADLSPLTVERVRQARPMLLALVGAAFLLLVLTCTNVANLLLVRALDRRSELALRTALGADRGRLARLLMVESLMVAVPGGLLALLLAAGGIDALKILLPMDTNLRGLESATMDPALAAWGLGLAILAGLGMGALPVLHLTRSTLGRNLGDGGRAVTGGRRQHRLRQSLVALQTALAVLLLVGSGLLLRSAVNLQRVDPGFDTENLLTFQLRLPRASYPTREEIRAFFPRLQERLTALPGVVSVGALSSPPLAGLDTDTSFEIEGRPPDPSGERRTTWYRRILPGTLGTLGLELLAGRTLDMRDHPEAPLAMLVNESFAEEYFPGESPLGQVLSTGEERRWTIVGQVENSRHFGMAREEPPTVYLAHAQSASSFMGVVVRTTVEPESLAPAVRRELAVLDPRLAAAGITSLEELVQRALAPQRATGWLVTLFAVMAGLVAALGIFSVVAHGARLRRREIGIRLVLGARSGEVQRLVAGQGLTAVVAGMLLGLGASLAVAWTVPPGPTAPVADTSSGLSGLLYEVPALDPWSFSLAALLMLTLGLVAALLPARRASRLDPRRVLDG